jgi:hypothetical protein
MPPLVCLPRNHKSLLPFHFHLCHRYSVARHLFCAEHARGAVGRRHGHGVRAGVRVLGARASRDELERGCDVEGGARTDSDGALSKCKASDLHRDIGWISGLRDCRRAGTRAHCDGGSVAVVFHQGAARREISRTRVWAEV